MVGDIDEALEKARGMSGEEEDSEEQEEDSGDESENGSGDDSGDGEE